MNYIFGGLKSTPKKESLPTTGDKIEGSEPIVPEEEQKLIQFGPMSLSSKFIFYEKRFVNCILPPNPILPGRNLYPLMSYYLLIALNFP